MAFDVREAVSGELRERGMEWVHRPEANR
jgi:hypothetical protein